MATLTNKEEEMGEYEKASKKNSWQKPTKFQIFNLIISFTALLIATTSLILRLLKLKG